MADQLSFEPAGRATGFGYFVLKLRRAPAGDPPLCAGVIERLGTAERRSFENAEELVRVLAGWAVATPKMT